MSRLESHHPVSRYVYANTPKSETVPFPSISGKGYLACHLFKIDVSSVVRHPYICNIQSYF